MTDKQVYELTIDDLACFGVWYFPMDGFVEDELTVRPLPEKEVCADTQLIVRASFLGVDGSRYLGYLYWDGSGYVEYLKPVVLFEDGSSVSFWNGMVKPSWGLLCKGSRAKNALASFICFRVSSWSASNHRCT